MKGTMQEQGESAVGDAGKGIAAWVGQQRQQATGSSRQQGQL
jgi:hypothetical protein